MAQMTYNYASMNSGKSTALLQKAHNYRERGYKTLIFTSALDDRYEVGKVTSRIGIMADAIIIPQGNLSVIEEIISIAIGSYQAVFVDECQFLSAEQVDLLSDIVDNHDVDVFCYGIKTDFSSLLFTGSKRLFEISDVINELDNICKCGKPAIMNARLVESTDTVLIGGNELYDSMCRKCYKLHNKNK